jgi:hypothetical protein
MSWDYSKYEAICRDCGRKGVCIRGSDDWGRTARRWEGFENHEPPRMLVIRKIVSSRHMMPVCACGSSNISVGKDLETPLNDETFPVLTTVPKKQLTQTPVYVPPSGTFEIPTMGRPKKASRVRSGRLRSVVKESARESSNSGLKELMCDRCGRRGTYAWYSDEPGQPLRAFVGWENKSLFGWTTKMREVRPTSRTRRCPCGSSKVSIVRTI